jgi:serine/threonine protein kinase
MTRYDNLPNGYMVGNRLMVESLLGKGRSSAVYRAMDMQTATRVSLKVLDPFLAQDPVSLRRFSREVAIIRSLCHGNIIKLYSCLKSGEFHVIVMEYFEGLDGISFLDRYGVLSIDDFLPIARQVVSAIQSCHKVKILHRDLKPHNILISADKNCKVVDFGISRINTMSDLTKTGTILGSPEYMAPELFLFGRADPRSDIYALGAIFYELLTGRPPYSGGSLSVVMSRQLSEDMTEIGHFRQDVPQWLEIIIRRCLNVDANKRYQSCSELLQDLELGEHVHAAEAAVTVECFGCKAELIPGLPFCHNCGKFSHEIVESGTYAIVLHRCGSPKDLADYLRKAFPDAKRSDLKHRLEQFPTLLFKNISKNMAHSIVHELSTFSLDLGIVENLPRHFQLPSYYFILGLLPVVLACYLPVSGGIYLGLALVATLLGEGFIYTLYRRKVSAVVSLGTGKRSSVGDRPEEVAKLAARFNTLSQPGVKYLMGIIAQKFLRLSQRARKSALTVDAKLLRQMVEAGFDAAGLVEKYENYLNGNSLNAIKANIDRLELRIKSSHESASVAALMTEKSKYDAEFARYAEVQDKHAKLHMTLLELRVSFTRLDASLDLSPEELRSVTEELAVLPDEPVTYAG